MSLARRTVGHSFGHGDLVVEYRWFDGLGDGCHHQIFEDGSLVAWEPGHADPAELILRQPWTAHLAMFTRAATGDVLLGATEVGTDADHLTAPAPLDEILTDWTADLPEIPTAGTVVVEQVLTHSPFGEVATSFRLDRGRIVDSCPGRTEGADVHAERRYALALAERAGDIDLFESFDGGSVVGDTPSLALFLGIYDDDDCAGARRALTRPYCHRLGVLGDLLSSTTWEAQVASLTGAATTMACVP